MIVTRNVKMDLALPVAVPWVDAVQDDRYTRNLAVALYRCSNPWQIPADSQVLVRYRKPDGKGGEYDTLPDGSKAYSLEGNVVTVALAPQVLTAEGTVEITVSLVCQDRELSLFPIYLRVSPNVGAKIAASEHYTNVTGFVPAPETAQVGQLLQVSGIANRGKVKSVEAVEPEQVVVTVPTGRISDSVKTQGNLLRRSFHLGGRIKLEDHTGYQIHRLGIRANPGTEVRFALYGLDANVMTRIAVLGDAVADGNMEAVLELDKPYWVQRDNTILLACARTEALHCCVLAEGMVISDVVQYADGDYVDQTTGSQIPCTDEEMDSGDAVAFGCFLRELEFQTEQTLEDYFRTVDRRIGNLEQMDPEIPQNISWNDLTDKPFHEKITEIALREYTVLDGFAPNEEFMGLYSSTEYPAGYVVELGQTYTVKWDGICYTCVAQDMSSVIPGAVGLGNLSSYGGAATAEPFAVGLTAGAAVYFHLDTENPRTSHEIGICCSSVEIKKLDEKFLPMDAINARINEALGVIENGTY